MPAAPYLTDDERFPLMTEKGRALLKRLREHAHAPRFNMQCGDRLTARGREEVARFEESLIASPPRWKDAGVPDWLQDFTHRCLREVPIYRRRGGSAGDFFSLPSVARDDLAREPWSFVPDDAPLDDLIVYYTSGASGRPMDVLCHPEAAAKRLPLFRRALAAHGAVLAGGPDRVAIVFACAQQTTLTYASVATYLGEAGHVKVNLRASEWRRPEDPVRFLDDCAPEIYTGDPLSFSELAKLPVAGRPRALISSAMALLPETRTEIEKRFGCPVVDIYSTCETGPIAYADGPGFRILPNDLFVEVLDGEGRPCPPGVRGEIAVTGGRNPFLPLLRYRTGDWASLHFDREGPRLEGLEGRAPVVFMAQSGEPVNNIDVTAALRPFALAQFALHQSADGSLSFRFRGSEHARAAIDAALRGLFGADQPIAFGDLSPEQWKVAPFRSDRTVAP